jgi:hypothetical protein
MADAHLGPVDVDLLRAPMHVCARGSKHSRGDRLGPCNRGGPRPLPPAQCTRVAGSETCHTSTRASRTTARHSAGPSSGAKLHSDRPRTRTTHRPPRLRRRRRRCGSPESCQRTLARPPRRRSFRRPSHPQSR